MPDEQDQEQALPAELPEWDTVAPNFKKQFPELSEEEMRPQYEKARKDRLDAHKIGTAYQYYKSNADELWGRGSGSYLSERVPVVSGLQDADQYLRIRRSAKAIEGGSAKDADYMNVAQFKAKHDYESEKGTGEKVVDELTKLPGIVGEFLATGGAAAGAREAAGSAAAKYAGEGVLSRSAGRLAAAGTHAALMPSGALAGAEQRSLAQGGEVYEPQNVGPAFVYSTLQNLVLGSMGETANGVKNPALRYVSKIGLGVGEMESAKIAASAVDQVLPEAYQTKTNFGILGDLLDGKRGKAIQDAVVETVTMAAFAAMHGSKVEPKDTVKALAEAINSGAKQGQSIDQVAAQLKEVVQAKKDQIVPPEGPTDVSKPLSPRVPAQPDPSLAPPASPAAKPAEGPTDVSKPLHPPEPPQALQQPVPEAWPKERVNTMRDALVAVGEKAKGRSDAWVIKRATELKLDQFESAEPVKVAKEVATLPPEHVADEHAKAEKELNDAIAEQTSQLRAAGHDEETIRSQIEGALQQGAKDAQLAAEAQGTARPAEGNSQDAPAASSSSPAASDGVKPEAFGKPLSEAEKAKGTLGGGSGESDSSAGAAKTLTALANEVTDKERARAQLPPILSEARLEDAKVWDAAMKRLDADPEAGAKLVAELNKKSRATTDEENALLLQRRVAVSNEYDRVVREAVEGYRGKASVGEQDRLDAKADALLTMRDETDKAIVASGREWGRAGRWRRVLAAEDFTLSGMLLGAERAKGEPLTPEEQAKITELQAKIAELQRKYDDALEPAKGRKYDPRSGRLQGQDELVGLKRAKGEFDSLLKGFETGKQPLLQRVFDLFVRFERAMKLTSPVTFVKIAAAGAEQAAMGPVREAAGSIGRQLPLMSKIMAGAPSEGRGLNIAREQTVAYSLWTEGLKDALDIGKTSKSELHILGGKDAMRSMSDLYSEPGNKLDVALDLPGRSHGMEKAPVMRAAYTRSKLARIEHNAENGIKQTPWQDMQDTKAAIKDGFREIFSEDNVFSDMFNAALKKGGPVAQTIGRLAVPFTKIPTNVVKQTFEYMLGQPIAWGRGLAALAKGLDTLTPEQNDSIARQFKRGSVGAGFLLWGLFDPDRFGGLYQQGEREKKDVGWGAMKLGGVTLPAWTQHHPAFIVAQIGATIRRNLDHVSKGGVKADAIHAVGQALLDEVGEVPYVRVAEQFDKLADPKDRGYTFGETVKSFTVPAFLQWLARATDVKEGQQPFFGEQVKRKPATTWQHVKTGIPGLRQRVPRK